ncbi:hypothetical protein C1H46_018963 [Malus baccata]|uniref:Uncharacterized protein n=1 Tax=Malus baccata TaxID=106549 RepID=A0A540M9J5_MALBA|nr:hypothetical protein C1H46_018963 [Malus baccata]
MATPFIGTPATSKKVAPSTEQQQQQKAKAWIRRILPYSSHIYLYGRGSIATAGFPIPDTTFRNDRSRRPRTRPDKAEALKQLRSHVAMFRAWVVAIRATPYVLHLLSEEKDKLKLEF